MKRRNIIFVAGTDTDVGKTLLTGMLLNYARQQKIHALAMKPFCSGGTGDVDFIQQIQGFELTTEEVNPYYFSQPVAPAAAMRGRKKTILMEDVLEKIAVVSRKCDLLLIEGSGGLLVPLGPGYFVADLIAKLQCNVVLVARNKLGTINHTLLSVAALEKRKAARDLKIVLMEQKKPDISSLTNASVLEKLTCRQIFSIPFFLKTPMKRAHLRDNGKIIEKTLAEIVPRTYFPRRSLKGELDGTKKKSEKRLKSPLTVRGKFIK